MGTKNNPGKFDCYAKADADEPIFTLRAKDPFAAPFVNMWAAFAIGDIYAAIDAFNACARVAIDMPHNLGYESEKFREAINNSEEMRVWLQENR